ncbi:unnamed protein product [Blepharisma stoltei]|uniref:Uncharacterized protein n=1 Tax=Blepharisma stoltei TaxID=1481888 RepID=A0AAU9IC65_9CILI|nr:unnamed protein product [Blepharisma stoltei]
MAIGFSQEFIYLWDFEDEKIISIFHSHKSGIKNVTFSYCENYLVSSGDDGIVKVWNISTLIEKRKPSRSLQKKAIFINREEIIGLDKGWTYLEWSSVGHNFADPDSLLKPIDKI